MRVHMSTVDLFDRIIELGRWEEYTNYAMFAWFNQHQSMFNSALAFLQRPGVAWLLTENEWGNHGRTIRPDATPIVLMKPFGPVYFYYDFADTEGDYVPRDIKSLKEFHFPEPQPVAEKFLPVLKKACGYLSISYYEKLWERHSSESQDHVSNQRSIPGGMMKVKLIRQTIMSLSAVPQTIPDVSMHYFMS